MNLPCGVCSSGRQWQCAGGARAAGGAAAGHTAVVGEGPAGRRGFAVAGRVSTRWGRGDDTAAGTAGAGGRPCQGAALGEEEEGGWCSSATGSVSRRGSRAGYGSSEQARVTAHGAAGAAGATRAVHCITTYMRGRRRIGAVGGLLGGGRLPV